MCNVEDQIKLSKHNNELTKEAHRRRLDWLAATIVSVGFVVTVVGYVLGG